MILLRMNNDNNIMNDNDSNINNITADDNNKNNNNVTADVVRNKKEAAVKRSIIGIKNNRLIITR